MRKESTKMMRLRKQNKELISTLKGMIYIEEDNLRGNDDIDICDELKVAREVLYKFMKGKK